MLGLLLILTVLCIAAKVWERWNRYHLAEIGMICRECNLKAAQAQILRRF